MARSIKFLFSAAHSTESGAWRIQMARDMVKSANAQARESGDPVRLRIVTSPRGKPEKHSWKYNNKHMSGMKRWRREDADHLDVYLVRKA